MNVYHDLLARDRQGSFCHKYDPQMEGCSGSAALFLYCCYKIPSSSLKSSIFFVLVAPEIKLMCKLLYLSDSKCTQPSLLFLIRQKSQRTLAIFGRQFCELTTISFSSFQKYLSVVVSAIFFSRILEESFRSLTGIFLPMCARLNFFST
jgi:hypothetical protein